MREHGRGLDGRTVARGMHRQSGELLLGRRLRRGLLGERVQARLGRQKAGKTGKPTAQSSAILARY